MKGTGSPEENTWQTYHSDPDEDPVEALLYAVSAITNKPPDEIPLLYETIDPDALNQLIERPTADDIDLEITFDYDGYRILVDESSVRVKES